MKICANGSAAKVHLVRKKAGLTATHVAKIRKQAVKSALHVADQVAKNVQNIHHVAQPLRRVAKEASGAKNPREVRKDEYEN